ncbi:FHA domain-containing protein [Thalassobacillus sp. C254]|uniref:FHA domain-containing protein n=1 Tax=Thalassobacillus sp. C254 TaxID=1225341 RepID=UPI0006D07909|nr:FHA domain-containing protein [Thalassobacillus sp. C254]
MEEVRVCPVCGYHNPLDSLFCKGDGCGEDISFIPPTAVNELVDEDEQVNEEPVSPDPVTTGESHPNQTIRMSEVILRSSMSGYEITIPVTGGTIGRSGNVVPEHFQNNQFVSNTHADILPGSAGYVLIDQNSTNGTKLNGERLLAQREYPLQDGDRVTFANMEFMVESR